MDSRALGDARRCFGRSEHLLQVEHTALLPGSALLMPKDDISVRCSFVDFDGDMALRNWRKKMPVTEEEKDAFVHTCCPLVIDGVKYISRYLEQVRQGKLPEHF